MPLGDLGSLQIGRLRCDVKAACALLRTLHLGTHSACQTPWVQVQSVDSMVSRLGQFIAVLCETLPVLIRGAPGPGESL